jgi:hypothetical protein
MRPRSSARAWARQPNDPDEIQMRSAVKEWSLRLLLLTTSVAVSLVLVEVVLTAFFPLYGGRDNVTLDGQPLRGWFPPGTVYRQISNEYDVETTITDRGHRVPGTDGNPDVIFLGDSFTYGFGLRDDETFSSIYCRTLKRACVNLGLPGSGTEKQLLRLQEFIAKWNWKPAEVKLFFFGMSGSFSAGNDFVDNYNYARRVEATETGDSTPVTTPRHTLAGRIIGTQYFLLEHSNLVRRPKYHWGPTLRTLLINQPTEARMAEALAITGDSLARLDAYSREVGFGYQIYLIVPVQDITRGTYGQTLATLNAVAPKPAIQTAQLLLDSPKQYYFSYDGHLNSVGNRRLADFLIASDTR